MDEDLAERLWNGMHRQDLIAVPVMGGWTEHHAGYDVVRLPALPLPDLNCVWADHEIDPGTLASEVARIEADGVPAAVMMWAGRTPRTEAAARGIGLTLDDREPGMALAPADLAIPRSVDAEVVRVQGSALREAQRVAELGFGVTEGLFAPNYGPSIGSHPGVGYYVAYAGGRPVSTAVGFTTEDIVCIYAVATPAEHRGKGYGAAVTARAVQDGFATGATLAVLSASPLGEPVYRRLGFREVLRYALLRRPA